MVRNTAAHQKTHRVLNDYSKITGDEVEIKTTSEITVKKIQRLLSRRYRVAVMIWQLPTLLGCIMIVTLCLGGKTHQDVEKLINYLMKQRHGTPFEHGFMSLYCHCPIFVWREWHRHRVGFSYNEESGRYKTLEPVFYVPSIDRPCIKIEDDGKKWVAARPKFRVINQQDPVELEKFHNLCDNLYNSYTVGYESYLDNLAGGFDPGLARDCLPVGIYSGCWVSCNPRSIMHFLSLRTHEPSVLEIGGKISYPLYEIEVAARKLESEFAAQWPITYGAWNDNGRVAP